MTEPMLEERMDALVGRVFLIEDITRGDMKQGFIARYRGRLRGEDSAAAYDELAGNLKSLNLTPLFRKDEQRHAILLIPGLPKPRPSNPLINLGLFILTILSVLLTGALYGIDTSFPRDPLQAVEAFFSKGWPFAVSMLAILAAHEFGHYLAGRYHGVHVTLPYFIPFPFSPFGTLGAFINMKEPPRNRRILLDIGIAGPLAGLVLAVPILWLGLHLSSLDKLPLATIPGQSLQMEGNSILYLLMKFIVFGKLLPAPGSLGVTPPMLYWFKYLITGQPFPFGGTDVMLHPVAWAGWAGLLVTAMNLIPAGQLDGGHMIYVLFGKTGARKLLPFILAFVVLLGFVWSGWWLWAALIFFLGRAYAEPLDQITPLDGKRKALALLALLIFVLVFTPVPLSLI